MNSTNITNPSRLLEQVLFDVELQPLFAELKQSGGLFNKKVTIPKYLAVVNQRSGHVLSVVGKNYRLISNREALDLGKQLFRKLYPSVNPDELVPFRVIAPISRASVHIDLIHPMVNFSVLEQETWLPFIRVTNSYNKALALTFEIGFVRKLCSNGVMFKKDSLTLKYYHSKKNKLDYLRDIRQIETAKSDFIRKCHQLEKLSVSYEMMIPLVFNALNISTTINNNDHIGRKLNHLERLIQTTRQLIGKYTKELGENSYAAFNVMTDLVSHEDVHKCLPAFQLQVQSYYSKPSVWLDTFVREQTKPDFKIEEYLKETILGLKNLEQETGLKWRLN